MVKPCTLEAGVDTSCGYADQRKCPHFVEGGSTPADLHQSRTFAVCSQPKGEPDRVVPAELARTLHATQLPKPATTLQESPKETLEPDPTSSNPKTVMVKQEPNRAVEPEPATPLQEPAEVSVINWLVQQPHCPYCDEEDMKNFVRYGHRKTLKGIVQRLMCKECGARFTPPNPLSRVYGVSAVSEALRLRTDSKMSYGAISKYLHRTRGIQVSRSTVLRWVVEAKEQPEDWWLTRHDYDDIPPPGGGSTVKAGPPQSFRSSLSRSS